MAHSLDVSTLALRPSHCPACGTTCLVRYSAHESGVRCLRCRATPITMSLIDVLGGVAPELRGLRVFELSSRGPLVEFLRRSGATLTLSEYFDGVPRGQRVGDVECQDVTALTFTDASFDLCTSTEVFEHVGDDTRGFREVFRVLAPGGCLVFTVPMHKGLETITRARAGPGGPVHLLEPEYHGDRLRPQGALCYRVYGTDVIDRLADAGFESVALETPRADWFGFSRTVVVARKASAPGG